MKTGLREDIATIRMRVADIICDAFPSSPGIFRENSEAAAQRIINYIREQGVPEKLTDDTVTWGFTGNLGYNAAIDEMKRRLG